MLLQHKLLQPLYGILSSVVHIRDDLLWDLSLEGEQEAEQKWIEYDPSYVPSAEYLSDLMVNSPTAGKCVNGDTEERFS